jgi:hypothetical protein
MDKIKIAHFFSKKKLALQTFNKKQSTNQEARRAIELPFLLQTTSRLSPIAKQFPCALNQHTNDNERKGSTKNCVLKNASQIVD